MAGKSLLKKLIEPLEAEPALKGVREGLASIVTGAKDEVKHQTRASGSDAAEQITGATEHGKLAKSGDIFTAHHQSADAAPHDTLHAKVEIAHGTAGAEYLQQWGLNEQLRRNSSQEQHQQNSRIQEIMAELQRIVASLQAVQPEVAQITLQESSMKASKYHENFLEWVLALVKQTRMKVEDAGAWMATSNSKKSKGYWGMAKKHGTSFSLSNERTVATQTG